ncbi:MAG: L-rhamnose isomerase, partial [Christensenellales bacterium]
MDEKTILKNYEYAKELYADFGVDADKAVKEFSEIKISLHCWQGDDIKGFEAKTVKSENVVTGNYPYAARNASELRADIEKVFSLSPSSHKLNLHSVYAENTDKGRDELEIDAFSGWIEWARKNKVGLDYNPSFFAHEMMDNGMSLASPKKDVREFWIRHGQSSREIAYGLGKALGEVCVCNLWIPDGLKDDPADRLYFRRLLTDSLNRIFNKKYDKKYLVDTLEGKLFGIGTECFVAGSYDYYLAYAIKNNIGICLDSGHYHPTESIADKFSALCDFTDDILLHISRGVRWDSDHVVKYDDTLNSIMTEAKRADMLKKLHIGLDYFDASINRIFAWAVGLRNADRALLTALLEPTERIKEAEKAGDYGLRLALSEEAKALPSSAVWDYLCLTKNVPAGMEWLKEVKS